MTRDCAVQQALHCMSPLVAQDDTTPEACVRSTQLADDLAESPAPTPSGDAMSVVWGTAIKAGTLQPRCLAAGRDYGSLRIAARRKKLPQPRLGRG